MQAARQNGVQETEYLVYNPSFFPTVPAPGSPLLAGAALLPTIYQISPNLRAPYTMQTAATLERQLTKASTLSVTYMNSRGNHQFFTNNINTPKLGSFPADPNYPNGKAENIYQYESEGIFKENQLVVNTNVRAGAKVMLFGHARSPTTIATRPDWKLPLEPIRHFG